MTDHTHDDTRVTSKYESHTFRLKDVNALLEKHNACLLIEADDKGSIVNATILDGDGYPATVQRMLDFVGKPRERTGSKEQ